MTVFSRTTDRADVGGMVFFPAQEHYGTSGHDIMIGSSSGVHQEVWWGRDGDDYINGGGGIDLIYGGNGHDVLVGGTGNDELYGEAGHDRLIGGAGRDRLVGGEGSDTFVFNSRDSGGTQATADVIVDFSLEDRIDVPDHLLNDHISLVLYRNIGSVEEAMALANEASAQNLLESGGITRAYLVYNEITDTGYLVMDLDAVRINVMEAAVVITGINTMPADALDWLLI